MNTIDHIMALADAYAQNAAWDRSTDDSDKQRQALRAAIEQALTPGEPLGYLWPTGRHPEFRFTQQMRDGVAGTPVYTAPQPQPVREPVDERALIRKVDAELEAHGLESYTTVHTSRYRLLTAVRHFLSVATGHLPDWLLQPAQAMRDATEEGITK